MKSLPVIAICTLTLAVGAYAEGDSTSKKDQQMKSEVEFTKLDTNKDGKLTRAEAAGDIILTSKWAVADVDENGIVNKQEFILYFQEATASGPADED